MGRVETVSVATAAAGLPAALFLAWKVQRTCETLRPGIVAYIRNPARFLICWWALYPALLILDAAFSLNVATDGPRMSALIVYPFWVGTVLIAQLAPYLVFFDLLRFLARLLPSSVRNRALRMEPMAALACLILVSAYSITTIYSDTCTVRVRHESVFVPNLPPELDQFRIVHIADLQADAYTDADRLQAYVDAANALDGDLLLFAGDLIVRGTGYVDIGAEMMGRMRGRVGRLACYGDHDI